MQRAHVLRFPTHVVVHGLSKTTAGVWIAIEPYVSLESDAPVELVGKAVLSALESSSLGVAHPTDWKAFNSARLVALGVPSEAKFHSIARLVEVQREGGQIVCTLTRNGGSAGPEKGFHELKAKLLAAHDDPLAVGLATTRAFEECTQ